DPAAALLSTLAVFAVGFVMRPIGGALLGAYADRHGRKKGLVLVPGSPFWPTTPWSPPPAPRKPPQVGMRHRAACPRQY
ncbi:MAG: transporter, family, alpha-ketoglutarate permease, partial [Pseudonocardiales bacterium]|nr:transporter, family, alpha-ketoglutarate permease [Pseudonocardiales bacterium]